MPSRRLTWAAILAALPGVMAPAAVAIAQDDEGDRRLPVATQELRQVEQDLDESRLRQTTLSERLSEYDQELMRLRGQMIDAAMSIMMQQEQLISVEERLDELAAEEAAVATALSTERERLARLLAALQRLSRIPPEALIVRPQAPIDTVRTSLLLRAAVPELEQEAAGLRAQLAELAVVRRRLTIERTAAEALRSRLDSQISLLTSMSEQRARLQRRTATQRDASEDRSRVLAERADDLRGLIEQLEIERLEREAEERRQAMAAAIASALDHVGAALHAAAEPFLAPPTLEPVGEDPPAEAVAAAEPPSEDAAGSGGWQVVSLAVPRAVEGTLLPASGQVVVAFGETDEFGEANEGVTLSVFPGAPVVAPIDGTIRFAGPFRRYGDILILEHGGGYHSLIIGLGRIDASVGQPVLAGEPLGVTALPQTDDRDRATLYFELRLNGSPVDPIPGLVTAQSRGHG